MIPAEKAAEVEADRADPCECRHKTKPCPNPGMWLAELHHVNLCCYEILRVLLCTPCKDNALMQAAEKLAQDSTCCRCGWHPTVVADLIVVVAL